MPRWYHGTEGGASADMREKGWEDKMDKSIAFQIEAIEKERQGANPPLIPKKRK